MTNLNIAEMLSYDLERTIESLERLRSTIARHALVAPVIELRTQRTDRRKDALKGFLDANCARTPDRYVRARVLWKAYRRWCVVNSIPPVRSTEFVRRLSSAGYEYSRSRRICGVQARTWEGLSLKGRSAK